MPIHKIRKALYFKVIVMQNHNWNLQMTSTMIKKSPKIVLEQKMNLIEVLKTKKILQTLNHKLFPNHIKKSKRHKI